MLLTTINEIRLIFPKKTAAYRFLFLVFCLIFYGPGRWVEDMNNAYGF
jgi:hypothetical protein